MFKILSDYIILVKNLSDLEDQIQNYDLGFILKAEDDRWL